MDFMQHLLHVLKTFDQISKLVTINLDKNKNDDNKGNTNKKPSHPHIQGRNN